MEEFFLNLIAIMPDLNLNEPIHCDKGLHFIAYFSVLKLTVLNWYPCTAKSLKFNNFVSFVILRRYGKSRLGCHSWNVSLSSACSCFLLLSQVHNLCLALLDIVIVGFLMIPLDCPIGMLMKRKLTWLQMKRSVSSSKNMKCRTDVEVDEWFQKLSTP